MMDKKGYGWRPQLKDIRDRKLSLPRIREQDLPASWDMRPIMPKIYDQGKLRSCTGNAIGCLVDFYREQTKYPWDFTPSRLFIYYNARRRDGTEEMDTGAYLRDAIKGVSRWGVCPEDGNPEWSWPYLEDGRQYRMRPRRPCYKDAALHTALTYEAVPQYSPEIKGLLVSNVPIAFGFYAYSNFSDDETAKSGIMLPPDPQIDRLEGGHAVVLVGYYDDYQVDGYSIRQWGIVRNSWGSSWGQDGYFLAPWQEVILNPNMRDDFWAIHSVGFKRSSYAQDTSDSANED